MNHILCHWCPVRLCLRINFSGDYVSIKVLRSRTLGYLVCPWYSTFALFLIQIKIWHTKNFFSLAIFDIAYILFFLNLKINCWQVVKLSGNVAGKTGPNPAGCWISVQSHSHLILSADWLSRTYTLLNCALFSFGLKTRQWRTSDFLSFGELWVGPWDQLTSRARQEDKNCSY